MENLGRTESVVTDNWLRVVFLVALLFFFKAAVYAWFVTPLWATPDEPGHYSYIEDLAAGYCPILGKAMIGADTTRSWLGEKAAPRLNSIAQHPPLYYALNTPILILARSAGLDFGEQVRSARLLTALFGAATLIALASLIAGVTGSTELGIAVAIFVSAAPMFLHLSSGVTHDTLLAFTGAWAAERYWRWISTRQLKYMYVCAVFLALGCITKITAMALAVPMAIFMCMQLLVMSRGWANRIFHVTCAALTTFLPIAIWMGRNQWLYGSPLADSSMLEAPEAPVSIGIWSFVSQQPFWQHTLINYFGLFGPTSNGALQSFQIAGLPLLFFAAAVLFCSLMTLTAPVWDHAKTVGYSTTALALCVTAYLLDTQSEMTVVTWACVGIALATVSSGFFHLKRAWRGGTHSTALLSASVCVAFFSLLYMFHLWHGYRGVLLATQGRYMYPVVPFAALIFAWSWRHGVFPKLGLILAIFSLVISDYFYLTQVLKFYEQVH